MTLIIEAIVAYAAIVGPALTAIFGLVFLFAKGIARVKGAAAEISSHEDIKQLVAENRSLRAELHKTNQSVRLLTDKIARIEGYSDAVLGDKEG